MSPSQVEQQIFINNPLYKGKGDNMVVFYVTTSQMVNIQKDYGGNVHEWIYQGGSLRIGGQLLYAGPNPVPN